MSKRTFVILVIVLIAGGAFYGFTRLRPAGVSNQQQPQNTPAVYSQSGEVTSVSPTQLTISYLTDIEVLGAKTPVQASKTVLLNETTPVFREDIPASISDIRVGMSVVIYLAQLQGDGPPLLAQKIDILKQ